MSERRLTDEEVEALAKEWLAWTDYIGLKPRQRLALKDSEIPILSDRFDELRAEEALNIVARSYLELRALLATPMLPKYEGAAKAYDEPQFYGGHIEASWLMHDLHVQDTVALGAALIRAALAAKSGEK